MPHDIAYSSARRPLGRHCVENLRSRLTFESSRCFKIDETFVRPLRETSWKRGEHENVNYGKRPINFFQENEDCSIASVVITTIVFDLR